MGVVRDRVAWALLALGVLAVAGCADEGQIALTNNAQAGVSVELGDEESVDVTADGGVILHTSECYDGPIVVTYADGGAVEFEGPLCPDQELVIRDEGAELVEVVDTD